MKSLHNVLFFDLDNTLVEIQDSHIFFDQIILDVFKEQDVMPPNREERNKLWRDANYKILLQTWNYPDPLDFWKRFDILDLKKRQELHNIGKLVLFDDVIPVLTKLSENEENYLILITNSSQEIVNFELETFALKQFFDSIIALGDTQEDCKPNPKRILEVLANIARKYDFEKDNVYIIGDSPFDISAGKNADIKSVLLRRKDRSNRKFQDEPDYVISSMSDVFRILKR